MGRGSHSWVSGSGRCPTAVFDFDLDETTMSALDSLDTTGHTDASMERRRKWWS